MRHHHHHHHHHHHRHPHHHHHHRHHHHHHHHRHYHLQTSQLPSCKTSGCRSPTRSPRAACWTLCTRTNKTSLMPVVTRWTTPALCRQVTCRLREMMPRMTTTCRPSRAMPLARWSSLRCCCRLRQRQRSLSKQQQPYSPKQPTQAPQPPNPKPQTPNPKPQTPRPTPHAPHTPNPKPQTLTRLQARATSPNPTTTPRPLPPLSPKYAHRFSVMTTMIQSRWGRPKQQPNRPPLLLLPNRQHHLHRPLPSRCPPSRRLRPKYAQYLGAKENIRQKGIVNLITREL